MTRKRGAEKKPRARVAGRGPKIRSRTAVRAAGSADGEGMRLPGPAARAALDRATTEIRRLQKDASRNYWVIGRRLLQVGELSLHRARGFATIQEYAEKTLGLAKYATFQYIRVASAFSAEVAALFGPEKLDWALRYIARTPEEEGPSDIPTLKIRIPASGEDPAVEKPFEEITLAELRLAVTGARPKGFMRKKPAEPFPEQIVASLAKAEKALDKVVGRAQAKAAELGARNGQDGEVLIEVRGIPAERARAAFRALAGAWR
ncbi:MAG: hypothetical protein HY698_14040 [Deltaproteobacteria bacterium]|nr:hypothetical protein [Deltaproteobacteria bacterium]